VITKSEITLPSGRTLYVGKIEPTLMNDELLARASGLHIEQLSELNETMKVIANQLSLQNDILRDILINIARINTDGIGTYET